MARTFTEAMREPFEREWQGLMVNPFVAEMADATLPPEKFRYYIEQNLQYLPEYAKVLGFGAARSATAAELERFARSIHQIVEVELGTNRQLRDGIIAQGAADMGGSLEPAPACLAYSSYLVATAATGTALDILAAILPCAWSYHEIAAQYPEPEPHPVYEGWLRFFSSNDYAEYLGNLLEELNELAGRVSDDDLPRLRRHFLAGLRFEAAFWEMAYELQKWPDPVST